MWAGIGALEETLAPSTGAGIVTAAATLLTAVGVLFGGLAVLMPAVRRITARVENVHTQVTANHHVSPGAPTLPDRLDDLGGDVKALVRVIDAHLLWSDEWTSRTERELAELHARMEGTEHDEPRRGPTPHPPTARPSSAGDGTAVVHQARQEGEGSTDRSSPA